MITVKVFWDNNRQNDSLMNQTRFHPLLFAVLLSGLVTACVAVVPQRGFDTAPTSSVVLRDGDVALAASPDRVSTAFGRQGLWLQNNASGQRRQLAPETPLALAWRRDGRQLAAAFPAVDQERGYLVVYDASGQRVDAWELPGRIVALTWSARNDLLAVGYQLRIFSFGANLSQWLIHVKDARIEQIPLGDMTIEPATARQWASMLPELLAVAFSPDGDELVLLRLHDPPQFPPYLQLLHRNWQVPGERKLKDLPVQPTTLAWAASGEAVNIQTTGQPVQRLELWPQMPVTASTATKSGLPDPLPSPRDDRLWTLRKWRFEGLITPEEFQEGLP